MDDPNITIEEYIRLEDENARRHDVDTWHEFDLHVPMLALTSQSMNLHGLHKVELSSSRSALHWNDKDSPIKHFFILRNMESTVDITALLRKHKFIMPLGGQFVQDDARSNGPEG
ncbi:hypothetical protein Tco_0666765 [Tanacetum coccineum]